MKCALLAFEKEGDELVFKMEIPDVPIDLLREIYGCDEGNEMFDSYPVSAEEAGLLKQYLATTIDFSKYEYFIERLVGPEQKDSNNYHC